MTEKTNPTNELEDIQFPLNHKLLEEANKIKQERKLIRERLKKVEVNKSSVSPSVYDKVRNDYVKRLEETTNTLLQKKNDIDRELATLYETRAKVAENVEIHKEKLEEIHFRHELSEYDDATFNKVATEENNKLTKFEKILAAVNSNIKRYESIFEGEEDLGLSTHKKKKEVKIEEPEESEEYSEEGFEEEEAEEEAQEYHVPTEEEGYFSSTDEIKLPQDTEVTGKTPVESITKKGAARLMIVHGENKGTTYDLKKETTIGRASSNTVVLKEAKVSRQHSVIKKKGNEYLIEDLNSSNGVFVNGERIKDYALSDGDEIRIGDFIMKFSQ